MEGLCETCAALRRGSWRAKRIGGPGRTHPCQHPFMGAGVTAFWGRESWLPDGR